MIELHNVVKSENWIYKIENLKTKILKIEN
jgi:hypothetical protein